MSLNTLVNYISRSQITSELIKRISKNKELNIVGSSRYAKSIILDSIAKKEDKNITCKDGYCFIPNSKGDKTISHENINIFDPL